MTEAYKKDEQILRQKVDELYAALGWQEGTAPDWARFRRDFREDAVLVPSARPAVPTTIDAFIKRMEGLRTNGTLKSMHETPLGYTFSIFGNTALVHSSYVTVINGGAPERGANAFLWIKNEGEWQIAAMGWDNETAEVPLPAALQG
jgi:hypothetical protein